MGLFLALFPREVVEGGQLVVVEVDGREFTQVPRLFLGFGEDLCASLLTARIKLVDSGTA